MSALEFAVATVPPADELTMSCEDVRFTVTRADRVVFSTTVAGIERVLLDLKVNDALVLWSTLADVVGVAL